MTDDRAHGKQGPNGPGDAEPRPDVFGPSVHPPHLQPQGPYASAYPPYGPGSAQYRSPIGSAPAAPPYVGGMSPTLRAAPRRRRLPWWVVLIIVVCAIPVLLFLAAAIMVVTDTSLPGSSDPKPAVPTFAADFETAWTLEPSAADPAATKWDSDPDGGYVDERLIAADGTWVAIASSASTRTVAGIDPEAGTVRWTEPLHDALCARELVDGALACLGRAEPTSATELRLYDPASGALRSHAEVRALADPLTIAVSSSGIVAVNGDGEAAVVVALAPDGTVRWSTRLADVPGADALLSTAGQKQFGAKDPKPALEYLRWRLLDDGALFLVAPPGAAIVDPSAGIRWAGECGSMTVLVDGVACVERTSPTDQQIIVRGFDGSARATVPGLGLARADGTQPRPVAVAGGALAWTAVDWSTGTQGEIVESFPKSTVKGFDGSSRSRVRATAGAAQRYVWQGSKVVAAPNDQDSVQWTWKLPADARTDVVRVVVFDDVVVVNERYGVDPKTGRTLWERSGGFTAVAFDGEFVDQATTDRISLLRLP